MNDASGSGAHRALSPTLRGMLWMAAAGALFTVLNALTKKLAHELDPWLVGFLRYMLGAMVMLLPMLRSGMRSLLPRAPKLQFVRGLFHAGGMLLWFAALPLITLAELTAISFSGPLFVCIGATLFLRERMNGARWSAVLVGFVGVMLVVRPWQGASFQGESAGVLLMLAASPMFAASFLFAKTLTRRDRSDVIVLWQHLWVSILMLPIALSAWVAPSGLQWLLLIACGVVGAAGHYCTTLAFRVADISAVQSLKFLELIWAALLGFALFGTIPAGWTLAGGLVILVSTLWLARSEARRI